MRRIARYGRSVGALFAAFVTLAGAADGESSPQSPLNAYLESRDRPGAADPWKGYAPAPAGQPNAAVRWPFEGRPAEPGATPQPARPARERAAARTPARERASPARAAVERAARRSTGPGSGRSAERAAPRGSERRIAVAKNRSDPSTSATAAAPRPDPVATGAVPAAPRDQNAVEPPRQPAVVLAAGTAISEGLAVRGIIEPSAPAPLAPGDAVNATAASFAIENGVNRLTIELSRKVDIEAFGLTDPYRLVVDLPEVRFDIATDVLKEPKGLVRSWRYGLFLAGRSRLVIDLAGPVRLGKATVEAVAGGKGRLVVEFDQASREDFLAHVRSAKPVLISEGTGVLGKGDREPPRPRRVKPMIVLDPGHGGIDIGTRSPATGTFEKGVVLEIAKLLEKKLQETGRYDVRLTRRDDVFVPLAERVRIARGHHADLFLSIHADAEYDRLVRGATVYTLDDRASDSQAAALAAKENESDSLAGVVPEETKDEVTDILIDLTVRETKRFSHVLARNLIEDLRTVGRLVKANPHRSANFRVLKAHDIPSALIELGFLTNKEDEQFLMSAEWREKTTSALVAAVDRYFQNKLANDAN